MSDIMLGGWSVHRRFAQTGDERLTLHKFPNVARVEFGLNAIELNNRFFDSTDDTYLKEVRAAADDLGVRILGICIDGLGDLSAEDDSVRAQAIANHRPWFHVSAVLGCTSLRANTGGHGDASKQELMERCIDSFGQLADAGKPYRIPIIIENHGGLSMDADNIVGIMEAVGDNIGTLPDFGNAAPETRYETMEKLAPYAKSVHAKALEFDEDGEEKRIDFSRCLGIMKRAGYAGYYGIEFEGRTDEHEGILNTKALLEKYL